ncbi:MAG TPA: PDZ domain-containing protein [Gemmatimonadota bacterium]|nr:PDZ domain-containing protein [Gemmatimonadota bacterium]
MRSRKIGWIVLAMALWGVPRAFAQQERAECADPAGELGIGELRCSSGRCLRGWAFQGGRLITTFTTEPSVHTLRPPADSVLEEGDVIVSVDGKLSTTAEASRRLRLLEPGDRVRLRIRRDGVEKDVTITAVPTCDFRRHGVLAIDREAGRDLAEALKHLDENLDIRLEGLDELSRNLELHVLPQLENLDFDFHFDFDTLGSGLLARVEPPYELGLELTCGFFCGWRRGEGETVVWRGQHPPKVAGIVEGGPADRAGIREGDVLLLLDGHSFVGEQGGRALGRLRPGQPVTLQYLKGGETLTTTTITPRARSAG